MAHLTLEYSANLRAGGNFPGLCAKLAATMVAQRDADKRGVPDWRHPRAGHSLAMTTASPTARRTRASCTRS